MKTKKSIKYGWVIQNKRTKKFAGPNCFGDEPAKRCLKHSIDDAFVMNRMLAVGQYDSSKEVLVRVSVESILTRKVEPM